jgi:hypothetical protein
MIIRLRFFMSIDGDSYRSQYEWNTEKLFKGREKYEYFGYNIHLPLNYEFKIDGQWIFYEKGMSTNLVNGDLVNRLMGIERRKKLELI